MGYVNCADGVTADYLKAGRYEININGRRFPATAHLRAPYDPERKRVLA
jgi:4-methylaminobutanoate oxidase (formaldehyde-forming)